jgi:hypothetical protein
MANSVPKLKKTGWILSAAAGLSLAATPTPMRFVLARCLGPRYRSSPLIAMLRAKDGVCPDRLDHGPELGAFERPHDQHRVREDDG